MGWAARKKDGQIKRDARAERWKGAVEALNVARGIGPRQPYTDTAIERLMVEVEKAKQPRREVA